MTLLAIPKVLDPFLPPAQDDQKWKRSWLAVGVGLGGPTLLILLLEGVPAYLERRRDRRLIAWGVRGQSEHGYFRLTPYERKDHECFIRPDGADVQVFDWLREAGPTVLYLTGRSGVGKSSLLNASVLPSLESSTPNWTIVKVRAYGDTVTDLAVTLRRPGLVYKQSPRDLPDEAVPLLRRLNERLKERDRRLLVVLDQFEEFFIFQDREPVQLEALLNLLNELEREPLDCIRLLLSMRSEYLQDVARVGLPNPHLGRNWIEIDAFMEAAAREFLRAGFGSEGLGVELVEAVVRHASELDEVRGKVRPIVLNTVGLALSVLPIRASKILSPHDARRLISDHVRAGLNDPLSRDHAPRILEKMVTPEGYKERPASGADLALRTGLREPVIQGCLARLNLLGFVRPLIADRQGSPTWQAWEISHDFVARELSRILPGLQPTIGRRLGRAIGPTLMAALILVPIVYQQFRASTELERVNQLQRWAGDYGATVRRLKTGQFELRFDRRDPPADFTGAVQADCAGFADLICVLDISSNRLQSLPPEIMKLTQLTTIDLKFCYLNSLPPQFGNLKQLTKLDFSGSGVKSLPPEFGKLTQLTTIDLKFNRLTSLPPEFGNLTKLATVDLSNNRLTSLPPEFGNLTGLETLDLSSNNLTSLPPEFGKLTRLTSLAVVNNRLIRLPRELARLSNLRELYVGGNPLVEPPSEVIERGCNAILFYLRSKLNFEFGTGKRTD